MNERFAFQNILVFAIHEIEGKINQILFLIGIHCDDGNTVLFISMAD